MKPALRLLASGTVLALVLWLVGVQGVGAALRGADPLWLALAIAALAAQIALSALRWRVTARALGHDLPRAWALREYGLSVAVNTFLPGGVLGDVGRILRSRGLGWKGAAASVLVERLSGQVALAAVGAVAVALWLGTWQGWALLAAAAALGVLGLALAPALRVLLAQAWCAPGIWPAQAGLSAAILLANLAGFWCAARAVGVSLGGVEGLVAIPLTLLSMLVPVTINGWGLREGVAGALWPLLGVDAPQAVAASVAFGLACMGAALVGLGAWLLRPGVQNGPVPR